MSSTVMKLKFAVQFVSRKNVGVKYKYSSKLHVFMQIEYNMPVSSKFCLS